MMHTKKQSRGLLNIKANQLDGRPARKRVSVAQRGTKRGGILSANIILFQGGDGKASTTSTPKKPASCTSTSTSVNLHGICSEIKNKGFYGSSFVLQHTEAGETVTQRMPLYSPFVTALRMGGAKESDGTSKAYPKRSPGK
jgi:ribosomal protein L19